MHNNLEYMLNRQIANWSVLSVKLRQYHWYVQGPLFFTLHAKFEELYQEASAHVDTLAERLLAIGGRPAATMQEYVNKAVIGEGNYTETAEEMVKAVLDDFAAMLRDLNDAMRASADDEVTHDLLLAMKASIEKQSWMLKAFLG